MKGKEAEKGYVIRSGGYYLNYELTSDQKDASRFILDCIRSSCDCALNAVCGAGKTEIIYESIKYCLNNKSKLQ